MSTQFRDYYAVLGVSRQASQDEIRKAFRKLARQYHPDVASEKATAEQKFKEINEAYEVLGDPDKRQRYDALGSAWQAGGERRGGRRSRYSTRSGGFGNDSFEGSEFHFGGTGFSDFFEQFFGSMGSGRRNRRTWQTDPFAGRQHRTGRRARGKDIEVDVLVSLEEAFTGVQRTITVQKGRSGASDSCQVKIPPGVREGQRLRIKDRGEKGIGGGPSGDLFLRVHVAKHPDFRLEEEALVYDLNVAPWEAVLGTSVSVPTPVGNVQIKIPAGTQSGARLRLKGYGMPSPQGEGRDDLFVFVWIKTPTQLTERERTLWEQLSQESSFKPRD